MKGQWGRVRGGSLSTGELYCCQGNLPQTAAEAARLRYLRGNSRGRGRKVFGVASTQRAQLSHDREEECEGVTKMGDRERMVEIMQEE